MRPEVGVCASLYDGEQRLVVAVFGLGLMVAVEAAIQPSLGQRQRFGRVFARGVDMFDCVMPTRNGRNGQLFTAEGVINIRNKKWEDDFSPIDPEGTAFVDTLYTKAYLHHLVTCGEMLAAQIASLHNIAFYLRLVTMAREHIAAGDFRPWKETMVQKLTQRL